jgi:hypothetical protein
MVEDSLLLTIRNVLTVGIIRALRASAAAQVAAVQATFMLKLVPKTVARGCYSAKTPLAERMTGR